MNADIFKAYDIRGKVGDDLNPASCKRIGQCFAQWLPTKGTVAVGYDMRPDSKELAQSLMEGIVSQGYDVWDLGLITSDMAYFAIGNWDLAGGAVITASHNPGSDNGIKLYRDGVVAIGLDTGLDVIRDNVLSSKVVELCDELGTITTKNITEQWTKHCMRFINKLKPFNIAIDAGNGMAGAILPYILPNLPLKSTNMYFELDGTFPNHEANPQKIENLSDLIDVIVKDNLDFGIAFDGDGDRAAFVDDLGRPVSGSHLITIAAKAYLEKYPGSEIVHEVRTSRSTQDFIKLWGGTTYRCKAGRVNIGKTMRERNSPFGGETTGHLFFRENFDADSGLIAALVIMQAISDDGRKLSEIIDEIQTYCVSPEINFTVNNPGVVMEKIAHKYSDGSQDMLDGITVNYPDYWFNIRTSNTEPLMRLNVEAKDNNTLHRVIDEIASIMGGKSK